MNVDKLLSIFDSSVWFSTKNPVGECTEAHLTHQWKLETQQNHWNIKNRIEKEKIEYGNTSNPHFLFETFWIRENITTVQHQASQKTSKATARLEEKEEDKSLVEIVLLILRSSYDNRFSERWNVDDIVDTVFRVVLCPTHIEDNCLETLHGMREIVHWLTPSIHQETLRCSVGRIVSLAEAIWRNASIDDAPATLEAAKDATKE